METSHLSFSKIDKLYKEEENNDFEMHILYNRKFISEIIPILSKILMMTKELQIRMCSNKTKPVK